MSEYIFKGDKGPWVVDEIPNKSDLKDAISVRNVDWNICDVYKDVEELEETFEHNALLIAAAPDLLEACIMTLQSLELHNLAPQSRHTLKAAIHKALNLNP